MQNKKIAEQLAAIDQKYQAEIVESLQSKRYRVLQLQINRWTIEGLVFDCGQISADQFFQDGYIFGNKPRQAGAVELNGMQPEVAIRSEVENDLFWQGLAGNTLGGINDGNKLSKIQKSGRTFRTPTFEIAADGKQPGIVYLKGSGSGSIIACVDSHRLIRGPLHGKTIQKASRGASWLQLDLKRYIGHRVHLEIVPDPGSNFAVQLVVQGIDRVTTKEIDRQLSVLDEPFVEFAEQASKALGIDSSQESTKQIFADFESGGFKDWKCHRRGV